jgi:hypothetical protein
MNADRTDFHGLNPRKSVLSVFIRVLFLGTLLASPLAAGQEAPPRFDLHRADGPPVSGPLVYLAKDWSLQLGEEPPLRLPGSDFVSLRRAGVAIPPLPEGAQVVLSNGDRLVIDAKGPLRTDGESLVCRPPWRANGEKDLSLPLTRVAAIWLEAPKGTADPEGLLRRLASEKRRQDLVLLTDGDRIN